MDIDGEKLEQTVLALLHLTSFTVRHKYNQKQLAGVVQWQNWSFPSF